MRLKLIKSVKKVPFDLLRMLNQSYNEFRFLVALVDMSAENTHTLGVCCCLCMFDFVFLFCFATHRSKRSGKTTARSDGGDFLRKLPVCMFILLVHFCAGLQWHDVPSIVKTVSCRTVSYQTNQVTWISYAIVCWIVYVNLCANIVAHLTNVNYLKLNKRERADERLKCDEMDCGMNSSHVWILHTANADPRCSPANVTQSIIWSLKSNFMAA